MVLTLLLSAALTLFALGSGNCTDPPAQGGMQKIELSANELVERDGHGSRYAMVATENPGTFAVTVESGAQRVTNDPTEVSSARVVVRAHCYETNSSAEYVMSSYRAPVPPEIGPQPNSMPDSRFPNDTDPPCMGLAVESVKITKWAMPPAPPQRYGTLYAAVQLGQREPPDGSAAQDFVYVFKMGRNDLTGQPYIEPVDSAAGTNSHGHICPCSEPEYAPNLCPHNPPWNHPPDLTSSTFETTGNVNIRGLIRHVGRTGNCRSPFDRIQDIAISLVQRGDQLPDRGWDAVVWWYEKRYSRCTEENWLPSDRLFGYRVDSSSNIPAPSGRWLVYGSSVDRPDGSVDGTGPIEIGTTDLEDRSDEIESADDVALDACYDPVSGRTYFQYSNKQDVVVAWQNPMLSTPLYRSSESEYYNGSTGYNDLVRLLSEISVHSGTSLACYRGTIDAGYSSNQHDQSVVCGAFARSGDGQTKNVFGYRLEQPANDLTVSPNLVIASGINANEPNWEYAGDVDVTPFGNPKSISSYGPSGDSASNDPMGTVFAYQGSEDVAANYVTCRTALWENNETAPLKQETKDISLAGQVRSSVNPTEGNDHAQVSQIKKRIELGASRTQLDRQLVYSYIGEDPGTNYPTVPAKYYLVIKKSGLQAFQYSHTLATGGNQSHRMVTGDTIHTVPGAQCLAWPGDEFWASAMAWIPENDPGSGEFGPYSDGASIAFSVYNVPGFESSDQIFRSYLRANVIANEMESGEHCLIQQKLLPFVFSGEDSVYAPGEGHSLAEAFSTGWQEAALTDTFEFFRQATIVSSGSYQDPAYFHLGIDALDQNDSFCKVGWNSNLKPYLRLYWIDWAPGGPGYTRYSPQDAYCGSRFDTNNPIPGLSREPLDLVACLQGTDSVARWLRMVIPPRTTLTVTVESQTGYGVGIGFYDADGVQQLKNPACSTGSVKHWYTNSTGKPQEILVDINHEASQACPSVALDCIETPDLATGWQHALALRGSGNLYGWGANWTGQLGIGNSTNKATPVSVSTLPANQVTAVGANQYFSAVTLQDQRVLTWGRNDSGQLGDGTTVNSNSPVEVKNQNGQTFTNASIGTPAIACGTGQVAVVGADGCVYTWGGNSLGALGDGGTMGTPPSRLYPGTVKTGTNGAELTGVCQLVAGENFFLARKTDNTVWGWGYGSWGNLANGGGSSTYAVQARINSTTALTNIVQIAAGYKSGYALTATGDVWAWGANTLHQLADGTVTARVYAQRVKCSDQAGDYLTHVVAITAGQQSACAVLETGMLLAWGDNSSGQLGIGGAGTVVPYPDPVSLATGTIAPEAIVGQLFGGCFTTTPETSPQGMGRRFGWGWNAAGPVGDNSWNNTLTPVQGYVIP